jgi:hypothetical protein
MNKYKLVICERFNRNIYGLDEFSDKDIENHFIIIKSYSYKVKEEEEDDDDEEYYEPRPTKPTRTIH